MPTTWFATFGIDGMKVKSLIPVMADKLKELEQEGFGRKRKIIKLRENEKIKNKYIAYNKNKMSQTLLIANAKLISKTYEKLYWSIDEKNAKILKKVGCTVKTVVKKNTEPVLIYLQKC